jgi:predicted DCC family thiol-disulfide oxidoreductase YuxK
MAATPQYPVLYFDGVCNLCNGAVQFIIRTDKKKQFRFASLQSAAGERMKHELKNTHGNIPDSLVLVYEGKNYMKSDAVLKIARLLGGVYSIARVGYIFPLFIRNAIYDWVARNRYKWYGKRDKCMIPTSELKSRFLD